MRKMFIGITITVSLFVSRDHLLCQNINQGRLCWWWQTWESFNSPELQGQVDIYCLFFMRYFVAKQLPGLVQWCLNLSAIQTVLGLTNVQWTKLSQEWQHLYCLSSKRVFMGKYMCASLRENSIHLLKSIKNLKMFEWQIVCL